MCNGNITNIDGGVVNPAANWELGTELGGWGEPKEGRKMEGERGGSGRMSSRIPDYGKCEPPAAKGREGKEKGFKGRQCR